MAISISNPAIRECGVSVAGATLYELAEPLTVVMQVGMGELRIMVPAGFVTDLATVPRVLWPFIAPSGPHQRAAIVHDYLYQCVGDVSRFLADAIFRDLMRQLDVPLWRRVLAYYAVRAFGGRHWAA